MNLCHATVNIQVEAYSASTCRCRYQPQAADLPQQHTYGRPEQASWVAVRDWARLGVTDKDGWPRRFVAAGKGRSASRALTVPFFPRSPEMIQNHALWAEKCMIPYHFRRSCGGLPLRSWNLANLDHFWRSWADPRHYDLGI
jgi:hypothetical protein